MFAVFKVEGTIPRENETLNKVASAFEITVFSNLRILVGML